MTKKGVENFDLQAVQIVDKGDYIELSPAIGNIRMIEKGYSSGRMNWNDAMQYAKNLRKGGFSDWRVPTKEELVMIYKIKDRCGISVDHFAFFFWSSSTYTDDTDAAWIVNFDLGYIDYAGKANDDIYVCCVR